MAAGLFFPVLASLLETFRQGDVFSFSIFSETYQQVPLPFKFVGPIVLGLLGFFWGRRSYARLQEQQAYAEELRKHSEELERRNASLSELNEALDGLVYTASHELRTPVVNFKSLLKLMRMAVDDPDAGISIPDLLDKLDQSSDRFMETIGNLLDVSRIESKIEAERERIELHSMLESVLKDLEEQTRASQAVFDIDTKAANQILMVRHDLRSIFQNLLSNALQFAAPSRNPMIKVRSFVREGHLLITVSDNGVGIDLQAHEGKIFRMFSRLSAGSRGDGVGLYVVKRTMDKAGGTIQVDSEPGKGATFQLSFPSNCIP